MQENESKKENAGWKSIEECLASEIIGGAKKEAKTMFIGIVCVTALAAVSVIGLLVVNHINTASFLNYLSEYDFVSQDGAGYNSGIGGNVNNGPEDQKTEEQEQGEGYGD